MTQVTTTGQDVLDSLTTGTIDDDLQIPWLNRAIRAAWPVIKQKAYWASAGTIAATTYVYSMAAANPAMSRELGVGRVFVTVPGDQQMMVREAMQYYDDVVGAWKVKLSSAFCGGWAGQALDVQYQYPHADIDALSETITLPHDYLAAYLEWLHLSQKLSVQTAADKNLPTLISQFYQVWNDRLLVHMTPQLSIPIYDGYEEMQGV